jgi:hypothetical protein
VSAAEPSALIRGPGTPPKPPTGPPVPATGPSMPEPGLPKRPPHPSLAAQLRAIAHAMVTDGSDSGALLLAVEAAARRADHQAAEAEIWWGEAGQREDAVAQLQRVRSELDRIAGALPPVAGPNSQGERGAHWVIALVREALDGPGSGAVTPDGETAC